MYICSRTNKKKNTKEKQTKTPGLLLAPNHLQRTHRTTQHRSSRGPLNDDSCDDFVLVFPKSCWVGTRHSLSELCAHHYWCLSSQATCTVVVVWFFCMCVPGWRSRRELTKHNFVTEIKLESIQRNETKGFPLFQHQYFAINQKIPSRQLSSAGKETTKQKGIGTPCISQVLNSDNKGNGYRNPISYGTSSKD